MKKALAILMVLILGTMCVFADYYISDYDVEITVGNNGVHHIVETITVHFEDYHHGIVREIAYDYRDFNGMVAHIENLQCSDPFEKGNDNGYLIMKIGSASEYVIGDKTYVISYDYDLGADLNEGYDEFYFNVIPHEWQCDIDFVSFSIEIPYVEGVGYDSYDQFADEVFEYSWFTGGGYGSTGPTENLDVTFYTYKDQSAVLFVGTDYYLGPYEGETVRVEFKDNWYQGARQPWDKRDTMAKIAPAATIILIALAFYIWSTYGKDSQPIVVARWTPPEDFSPLMVGYVADETVDDKDVISMLFYWADEGLLSIQELDKGKFEFTKLKDIEQFAIESKKAVPAHEIKLFNGFFEKCEVGDKVTFKDLEKNNFYDTIQETKRSTEGYFKKDRLLYDIKAGNFSVLFYFLAIIPLILGIMRIGWYENSSDVMLVPCVASLVLFIANLASFTTLFKKWYVRKNNTFAIIVRIIPSVIVTAIYMFAEAATGAKANLLLCAVSVFGSTAVSFFASIIGKRSKYGQQVFEQILGFRDFIDKVEIDKLKMLIDQDPDFYYRILSYSVVLGLEDKWAKKFDGMIVEQPQWYSGNAAFNAYYMGKMARRMSSSIPLASMPKSQASGHSSSRVGGGGFRSSGFSGGGFGGGGGHAW